MNSNRHIAILDIGSNAIRLVIYDSLNRTPVKIHNERIVCNLAADLSKTDRISDEAFKKAIEGIGSFARLIKDMNITNVRAVATAAIRDAENGQDLIDRVKADYNFVVEIIDGDDEARLSALGVLANGMGRNGIIGDFGGGSLELIVVEEGEVKQKVSIPIGSHRLLSEQSKEDIIKKINEALDTVDFLDSYIGKNFYALGGSWRSMAKAHINMVDYPIRTIDHYRIEGNKVMDFAQLISKQNQASMEKTMGLPRKRVKDLSVASLVMLELFKRIKPSNVYFSGTGLREGLLFEQMPAKSPDEDVLILSCIKYVSRNSRFNDMQMFEYLYDWILPLFAGKDAKILRWLKASCYLSDVSLYEHEEYQADHAFQRLLVMPFYGITHEGRAFLALTEYVRYNGYIRRNYRSKGKPEINRISQMILDSKTVDLTLIAGLALHMAYILTGGDLHLLNNSKFVVEGKNLKFEMKNGEKIVNIDSANETLLRIAEAMRLELKL